MTWCRGGYWPYMVATISATGQQWCGALRLGLGGAVVMLFCSSDVVVVEQCTVGAVRAHHLLFFCCITQSGF